MHLINSPPQRCRTAHQARAIAIALALTAISSSLWAQTRVTDAWVRSTVAQQKTTGLYALITSTRGGALVSASSPLVGLVEIHEMRMDGDIMRMRALPQLELPAGKVVELKPGAYHVMLMDLKQPLKVGDSVEVSLVVEAADKSRETIVVKAAVKASNTPHHKH